MWSTVMCVQQVDQRKLIKGDSKAHYFQREKTTTITVFILSNLKEHHSKPFFPDQIPNYTSKQKLALLQTH